MVAIHKNNKIIKISFKHFQRRFPFPMKIYELCIFVWMHLYIFFFVILWTRKLYFSEHKIICVKFPEVAIFISSLYKYFNRVVSNIYANNKLFYYFSDKRLVCKDINMFDVIHGLLNDLLNSLFKIKYYWIVFCWKMRNYVLANRH